MPTWPDILYFLSTNVYLLLPVALVFVALLARDRNYKLLWIWIRETGLGLPLNRLFLEYLTLAVLVCIVLAYFERAIQHPGIAPKGQLQLWDAIVGSIAAPLFGAYIALMATRRLSGNQLAPSLLQRFNSQEVYNSRRYTSHEMVYWYAGDRFLLLQYWIFDNFPIHFVSPPKPFDTQPTIGVTVLHGFASELMTYWLKGLLSGADLRHMFRDRMVWFIRFLHDFNAELWSVMPDENGNLNGLSDKWTSFASDKRIGYHRPFPFRKVQGWLAIILQHEAELTRAFPGRYCDMNWEDVSFVQPHELTETEYKNGSTLISNEHEKTRTDGKGPFIRLKGDGSLFFLEVSSPHPFGHTHFCRRLTKTEARQWFWRLRYQNYEPQNSGPALILLTSPSTDDERRPGKLRWVKRLFD